MQRKLNNILWLITITCLLLAAPANVWGLFSGTLDIRVSASSDDAEDQGSSPPNYSSSDLELVKGDGYEQIIGLRFENITIPPGSTITNAYIEFTADDDDGPGSGTTNLVFYGQDFSNPPDFDSGTISGRAKTSASEPWTNVPSWTAGVEYQSPDLTGIVQEIIELPSWHSGYAMVFIITGSDPAASGYRRALSYNDDPARAPLLHIEYTSDSFEVSVADNDDDAEESGTGSMDLGSSDLEMIAENTDQTVGLRFQSVDVPQGAIITNAYIMFTTDETDSEPTSLIIHGEDIDDAPVFTSSDDNITDRTLTSASVGWNSISAWDTVDEQHNTPDLSSVVQEIVGRSGWAANNDMVFIISGSGKRVAQSHDLSGGTPALLHIEYSQDPIPYITADPSAFGHSFYLGSNAESDTFTITNSGTLTLTYTVTVDETWLITDAVASTTLTPGSTDTITVIYNASALSAGTHQATITITDDNALAPNSPVEIDASLEILTLPTSSTCGHVPVYTENLVSPAILILLDISGSMTAMMNVSSAADDPKTPDLSTIVQEIVDRASWTSGNSMVYIIEGTGHRTAEAFDKSGGTPALLHVEYSGGPAGGLDIYVTSSSDDAEEVAGFGLINLTSSDLEMVNDSGHDQIIGMRFENIEIPQGATISNAYLQFVIDESNDETTSLTIYGEDLDDPPTFADSMLNISSRTKTTASVAWNASTTPPLEEWGGATQMSRIDIAKDAISELVVDRGISWGYGNWCYNTRSSSYNYTLVHVGCETHDDAHQVDLQDAITATVALGGTPLGPSLIAGKNYFMGNKADVGGDTYTAVDCQPMFVIDITDGLGYSPDTTVALMEQYTDDLADQEVSAIAVGFGLSNATQLDAMAQVANDRGNVADDDNLYALHEEVSGVAQPFLANNKDDLVDALATITESVKAAIFHGSAPAPTTSADLGDTVIIAKFDATDWSGDVEAVTQAPDGDWDLVKWTASNVMPSRNVYTIDPSDSTSVITYTDATLANDNWLCKDIGDIINSTPIVVGSPAYYYDFDGYANWKAGISRDPVVYIGANDGAIHAFGLSDGIEKWAFVPESVQSKLNMAVTDPVYDMCGDDYCHQYFVDGSPIAGDIYDGSNWKTILVCGLREGGEAYFALDVTSPNSFNYLWEFTDSELGETWAEAAIDRVEGLAGSGTVWGAFFGSGYSPTAQATKQAYLYGIVAHNKNDLWNDGANDTNRIKISPDGATGSLDYVSKIGTFTDGTLLTGVTSGAAGTIVSSSGADTGTLELANITGIFLDGETITDGVTGAALADETLEGARIDDALAPPITADLDADYISEHIYAGNLYGTMYRITNIGWGSTPVVSKLFNFSPPKTSPNENQIRAAATYAYGTDSGNIWVYFGTGRYETQIDKTTMQQQYFFGLKDDITPTNEYLYLAGTGLQINGNDLANLEAKYVFDVTTNTTVRYIDGSNPDNLSWAVTLDNTSSGMLGSERVIEKPLVAGGVVFFTTFIPDQDLCAGNGDTWVYAIDYSTGLAPDEPVFDLNDDGVIDDQDVATDASGNVYNVAAVSVGSGQGSAPVLYKKTLFVTTTGQGLTGLNVDVGDTNVQLGSWKEKF